MKQLTTNMALKGDNKQPAKLNPKQQAFVNAVMMDGLKPVDAYLLVYPDITRKVAHASASRLLKHPLVITAFSSLSDQVKSLETIPKHYLVQKLKSILERCDKEKNYKYMMESIDMINKMMGNYTTQKVVTQINLTEQAIDFGGWNPDNGQVIDITPSIEDISEPGNESLEDQDEDMPF